MLVQITKDVTLKNILLLTYNDFVIKGFLLQKRSDYQALGF